MLVDADSGPSLFRSYRRWHSRGGATTQTIDSPAIDAALDRVRHAASDEEYREGVRAFQQAIVDRSTGHLPGLGRARPRREPPIRGSPA